MKKLLVLAGSALLMAACSEAPTAPPIPKRSLAPSAGSSHDEITCRSGYIIAYDENGNPYCAPDGGQGAVPDPTPASVGTTTTSSPVSHPPQ